MFTLLTMIVSTSIRVFKFLHISVALAGLEINFGEPDYSFTEGSTSFSSPLTLQYRNNQNPFTVIIRAVSLETVVASGLEVFFNDINNTRRATAGS